MSDDEDNFKAMQEVARAAAAPPVPPSPGGPVAAEAITPTPPMVPIGASAAPRAPTGGDFSSDFAAHQEAITNQANMEQMAQAAKQVPKAAGAPPPAAEPEQPAPGTFSRTIPGADTIYDPATHRYIPDPNIHKGGVTGGAVVRDLGTGTLESPRAIYTGVRNALQNTFHATDDLVQWLNKVGTPAPGSEDYERYQQAQADPEMGEAADARLRAIVESKYVKDPTSVSGRAAQSVVQFVTGMYLATRVLGSDVPSTVRGALGAFTAFKGSEKRLSDLVESVPALRNPITHWLAVDPNDSDALGRVKNAAEGVGLGQLTQGLLKALKLNRAATKAAEGLESDRSQDPDQAPTATGEPLTSPGDVALQGAQTVAEESAEELPGAATGGVAEGIDEGASSAGQPQEPVPGVVRASAAIDANQAAKQLAAANEVGSIEPEQALRTAEPATAEELAGPRVPGATAAQAKEPVFHINLANIEGPDDVKRAMSELANSQADHIDEARRGVQSFEDTRVGAETKDAFQLLMERRQGQAFNDQEILASKQLYYQSASNTLDAIYAAADHPTPENVFAYRQAMTTHAMIQKEFLAAQAETARAVSAMRIPVGINDPARRLNLITEQLDQSGGLEANIEDVYKMKALVESGDMTALGNVAEKSAYARTRDALLSAWTNGLLTNPLTHIKVNLSNAATIALRLTETKVAETMDSLLGRENGVVAGETAQTTAGLIQSIKDSFRYAGAMARVGPPGYGPAFNIEAPASSPLADAAKAFETGHYSVGAPGTAWGQTLESGIATDTNQMSGSGWMGQGSNMLGQIVRTPGRALTAEHEFYRSIGMRMELNRYAIRQATAEVNAGSLDPANLQGRIAELIENPPPGLTEQAVNGMTYQTFTDAPGKLADLIQQGRENFPLLRVVIPFYKIPSRMLSFGFERSPLAPLMSRYQQEIAAGGARASMARAQMGLGSMVMLATSDAVLQGQITGAGPKEKGLREAMERQGWQPYSVKIGDNWFQYNRLETLGSSIAMAADATEAIRDFHSAVNTDDPDTTQLAAAMTLALANDVTSKSYLEGLANVFEAMGNPQEGAKSALINFAGSAVPAGLASADKNLPPSLGGDLYRRQVNSMSEAIRARTPGASEGLPIRRDLWGDPESNQSGLGRPYDAFVPFATKRGTDEPIDKELLRLGLNLPMPPATRTIDGVKVDLKKDPEIYSRYVQLAGNELKSPAWGLGAKDLLNKIVEGDHPLSTVYNLKTDGADGGKAVMIRDLVRDYRDKASKQILEEFPKLRAQVDAQRQAQQELKLRALQGQKATP